MKKEIGSYGLILLGSVIYAIATMAFIFPHSLLLGGTSGISVILNEYIPFSPGAILVAINVLLIIAAFAVLGREMALKTFVGSLLTTVFVGVFEKLSFVNGMHIPNIYVSAVVGAMLIAIASGIMFYIKSSSGGTDIIALIVKKYSGINIGRALLLTDILIVVVGGLVSGYTILMSSFVGFLVKVFGIDAVIGIIEKNKMRKKQC